MADFSNLAVTKNGSVLFADVQAGAVLIPTRIVLGSGDMPSEKTTETMTAVVAPVKELAINKRKRSPDGRATFGGMYTNSDVTESFYFREQALFCRAEYRDTSGNVTKDVDEVLFAYGNAGETADYMPAYDTNATVEKQIDIVVWIGNTVTVELTVESGVYMTQAQAQAIIDAHATNKSNPHGVTKAQVGLDNVPNVTPENQVPSFSNDYNAVTETDGVTSFSNIVNGDRLGAILQKIRTAIYVLVSHLNAANPHKITLKSIGAAASSHTHEVADINGTLGIANGGTGATTAKDAREKLGAAATITGAATTIANTDLTASRALVSDSNGKVGVSAVTATELGYLDGVTSNVQTQLNGKVPNSAAGQKDLLTTGNTVLSSYQYGTTLPTAGTKGRIFFKKV